MSSLVALTLIVLMPATPQHVEGGAQPPFADGSQALPRNTVIATNWDLESQHPSPCSPTSTDNDGCGYAYASVYSSGEATGKYVYSKGNARDYCTGTDAFAQAACTSTYIESWQYIGEEQGLATANATLSINGVVHLYDDDCAGAALGFVSYSSTVTTPVAAVLMESAAETTAVLGPLSFDVDLGGGIVVTITPTISTGLGSYQDSDSNATAGRACMAFFTQTMRARGSIDAYANSFALGSSRMRCSMVGSVSSTVVLTEK